MHYGKQAVIIAIALSLVFGALVGVQAEPQKVPRKPATITGKSFLPLKVLARPFSNIYKEADEKSAVVEENVPAFQIYFVYSKPKTSVTSSETKGWYEVGSDKRGTVLGWMKADDVMEWKSAMCLVFSQSPDRKPVLMFNDIIPLLKLISLPPEDRKLHSSKLYEQIQDKQSYSDFPVIAMEQEIAVDITSQFNFIPILETVEIEFEGRETHLIKIPSLIKGFRKISTLLATGEARKTLGSSKVFLGRKPISGWVIDRDLFDPGVSSLDVRVLLKKNNLNSLKKTLGEILGAAYRGQITGEDFFDALLAVTVLSIRAPERIINAKNLAATGLLPEFLEGIPYKSQIMNLNNEIWSSMSMDQQEEFLNGLDAKLQLYSTILDAPDGWISLNPGADEGDKVYPLPLESLP